MGLLVLFYSRERSTKYMSFNQKKCSPTYKNVAHISQESGQFGVGRFSAPQNQKNNQSSLLSYFPTELWKTNQFHYVCLSIRFFEYPSYFRFFEYPSYKSITNSLSHLVIHNDSSTIRLNDALMIFIFLYAYNKLHLVYLMISRVWTSY